MDRRSEYKNYMLPGIYHITVKAAETLRSPFGVVVGSIDKPDGDPDAPRVALSPVGQMVEQELLNSIAAYYPMVEVQDYVIMPEHMHFIVVVNRKIVNKQGREAHLGQVIAGFKLGCNRRWWKMTGQQLMRPEEEARQAEPAGTAAGGTAEGGTARSTGRVMIACDTYGDRKLLERKTLPVVCHRKDLKMLAKQQAGCSSSHRGDTITGAAKKASLSWNARP